MHTHAHVMQWFYVCMLCLYVCNGMSRCTVCTYVWVVCMYVCADAIYLCSDAMFVCAHELLCKNRTPQTRTHTPQLQLQLLLMSADAWLATIMMWATELWIRAPTREIHKTSAYSVLNTQPLVRDMYIIQIGDITDHEYFLQSSILWREKHDTVDYQQNVTPHFFQTNSTLLR